MATLYVVGAPTGDPDDLTLRAQRTLREAAGIITADMDSARLLLAHHGIETPLVAVEDAVCLYESAPLGDVALLCDGKGFGPAGLAARLIGEARERGVPVVPIPGPVLPLTALVLSGLPADSFVYLGRLPAGASELERVLSPVAREARTLVAQVAVESLVWTLQRLPGLLGDRPLAIVAAGQRAGPWVWRGALHDAVEQMEDLPGVGGCTLVMGGLREAPEPWDEGRLQAQVEAYLRQGLAVKEISQRLSPESGWSRRDIYALAVRVRKALE